MRPRVLLLGPNGQLGHDILRAHGLSGEPFDLLPLARGELDVAEPGAVERVVVRMLTDGCAPGLYHVVNSGAATWFEFAREIIRRAGVEATVTPCATGEYPVRAARPRYSVLDNKKTSAAFGPMPSWRDPLDRYLHAKGYPI